MIETIKRVIIKGNRNGSYFEIVKKDNALVQLKTYDGDDHTFSQEINNSDIDEIISFLQGIR